MQSISCGRSKRSAPGFLANENIRSPSGRSATNASVVNASSVRSKPFVLTPDCSIVSCKNNPCISLPTFPMKAAESPIFETAAATFATAPPGFCSKIRFPFSEIPHSVKSINNSPIVATSNILASPLNNQNQCF